MPGMFAWRRGACRMLFTPMKRPISTSIGGALIEHGEHTAQEILERADKALYEAKGSGRNCTVFENIGKLDPDEYKSENRPVVE